MQVLRRMTSGRVDKTENIIYVPLSRPVLLQDTERGLSGSFQAERVSSPEQGRDRKQQEQRII